MSVINVGKKILIIDDEPQIVYLMKIFLQDEGFEVSVCNNPEKVISIIKSENIHAVVCDFLMPQQNGLECIKTIRKEFGRDIPVVIVTGVSHLNVEKVREAGGNDLISKPIDFTKLSAILDRELSQNKENESEEVDDLEIKSFMLEAKDKKIPTRLTQLVDNKLYFELPKDKCALGSSKFFEIYFETNEEKVRFNVKGEIFNIVEIDATKDMIVVDMKIYDEETYLKVKKIYDDKQKLITDILKMSKE